MSRRKKITTVPAQTVLLGTIKKKVDDDGASSPLVAMLADKGIVLADDVAVGVTALLNNASFLAARKQGQILLQQRKLFMKPILSHTADCFQFLKTLYTPNFKLVGDWGATITDGGKLTYPADVAGQVDLLLAIQKQNDSYVSPAVSPLAPFLTLQGISLSDDAANGALAILRETGYLAAKKSSEDFRQLRDKYWPFAVAHINMIGDFLMKLYKGNEKALGAYGFVVINDPKVVKTRIVTLAVGEKKLKIVVKIGSTIFNSGTVGVNIYKGETISGTPTLLAPGATFLVIKGYSTISVENTSATVKAEITLVPA